MQPLPFLQLYSYDSEAKEGKLLNVLGDQKKEDKKEDKWITPKEGGFLFACQTAKMSNQQYKVIENGFKQGEQLVAQIGNKVKQNKGSIKNIVYICDPKVVIQAIDSIAGTTQISVTHQKFSREGHASEIAFNFFLPFLNSIQGNASLLKDYLVSQAVTLQETQTQQKDKDLGILILLVSQFFGIQSLNLTYISIKTHEFTSIKKLACSSQTKQKINMQYQKFSWAYSKPCQIQNQPPRKEKWITPKEGGFLFACQTAKMSNQQYKVIENGFKQGEQLVAQIGNKVKQNKGSIKNIVYICDPKVVIQAIDSIAGTTQISVTHQKFSREGHASEIAFNFFLPFLNSIQGNASLLKDYLVSQAVTLQETQTQQKDKDLGILILLVSQFFGIQSLNLTYISIKTHEFTSIKKLACSSQTKQKINMQYQKFSWAYSKPCQIQNQPPRKEKWITPKEGGFLFACQTAKMSNQQYKVIENGFKQGEQLVAQIGNKVKQNKGSIKNIVYICDPKVVIQAIDSIAGTTQISVTHQKFSREGHASEIAFNFFLPFLNSIQGNASLLKDYLVSQAVTLQETQTQQKDKDLGILILLVSQFFGIQSLNLTYISIKTHEFTSIKKLACSSQTKQKINMQYQKFSWAYSKPCQIQNQPPRKEKWITPKEGGFLFACQTAKMSNQQYKVIENGFKQGEQLVAQIGNKVKQNKGSIKNIVYICDPKVVIQAIDSIAGTTQISVTHQKFSREGHASEIAFNFFLPFLNSIQGNASLLKDYLVSQAVTLQETQTQQKDKDLGILILLVSQFFGIQSLNLTYISIKTHEFTSIKKLACSSQTKQKINMQYQKFSWAYSKPCQIQNQPPRKEKWITPKEGGFLFACQTAKMSNQQYKVIENGFKQGEQLVTQIGNKVKQNKGSIKNIVYICDPKVVIQAIDSIAGTTQISVTHQKFSREGHASEIAFNFFLPFLNSIQGNASLLKDYLVSQAVTLQETQTQQKDKDLGILILLVSQFFGIQSLNLTYISIKTHEFTSIKKLACSSQTKQKINMQYQKFSWAYSKPCQIQNQPPRNLTLKGSYTYGKWYHTPYVSCNMLFFAFQQKDKNFKKQIKQYYQESLIFYQSLMKTLQKKGIKCLEGLIFGSSKRVIQIIQNFYTDIKIITKSTREITYKHTGFYQLLKEMIGNCFEHVNQDISQLQNYFLIKLEGMQKTSKKISKSMQEADYKFNQVGTFLFISNCKAEEKYKKISIYYVSVNQKWFDSFKCSESQDQPNQAKTTKVQFVFYQSMVNQKKKSSDKKQDKEIQINTKTSSFVGSNQNYQNQYKGNLEKNPKSNSQNNQNEDQSESQNNYGMYN